MKPLKLEFEAFLSYKDKTIIDFSTLNNSIFLIDGDTGAGKTTIFDAMCFALYGEPSDTSRDAHFKSHFASDETISYVDFTFEEEGRIYNIYRQPRQFVKSKKRNAKGKYTLVEKNEEVKLELDKERVITKIKECNQKIIEIIKLKQDQFRNTVMIGQNKFADLIRSTTQNRKELFRSILQTAKFATFKDKVYEKYTDAYREIENDTVSIDTILKNYKASNEELINKLKIDHPSDIDFDLLNSLLNLDINALKDSLDRKETTSKELNIKLDNLKELYIKTDKNNQNLNNFVMHKNSYFDELKKEEEFKNKKEIVDTYRDSLDTYNMYNMYLEKSKTIEEKTKQISLNKETKSNLVPRLEIVNQNKNKISDLTKKNNELRLLKQSEECLIELASQLDKSRIRETELNKSIEYNKKELEILSISLKTNKKNIEELKKFNDENKNINVLIEKNETNIKDTKNMLSSTKTIYESYLDNIKNLEATELNIKIQEKNKDDLIEKINKNNLVIENNKKLVEENKNVSLELVKLDIERDKILDNLKIISNYQNDYNCLKNEKNNLETKLKNIESLSKKYNEKNGVYQRLNLEYKCNLAGILASNLNEGEACPVCGNTHHIKLAVKEANVDEDTLNNALKEVNDLNNALVKENAEYDAIIKAYEEKRTKLLSQLFDLTSQDINDFSIDEIINNYIKFQKQEEIKLEDKRNELSKTVAYIQKINVELENYVKQKEELNNFYNTTINFLAVAKENSKNYTLKIEECLQNLETNLPNVNKENILNKYSEFENALNKKLVDLENNKAKLSQILEEVNYNSDMIKNLENNCEIVKNKIDEKNNVVTTDETNLKSNRENINTLKIKLDGKTKEDLEKNIKGIILKINEIEETISKYNDEFNSINNQMIKLDNSIKNLENEVETLTKESVNLENNYKVSLANTKLKDIEKIVNFVCSNKALITSYDKEYSAFYQRLSALKSLYDEDLKNGYDKLEIEDLTKNLSEQTLIKNNISEVSIEVDSLKSMYTNNSQIIKQYIEKNEAIKNKNKYVSDLKKLYLVASGQVSGQEKIDFETYYQSQIFNNILFEANKKLSIMTDNVYTMIRHESSDDGNKTSTALDIDIFDTYTGKIRSANSLSGGETFMASLSLALGFSEISRNNSGAHELDCMFIDEGFGTLDEETLRTVMKVLNQLSNEANRTIGIISHVAELKDVISKQLHVTKDKTNGSKIQVRV